MVDPSVPKGNKSDNLTLFIECCEYTIGSEDPVPEVLQILVSSVEDRQIGQTLFERGPKDHRDFGRVELGHSCDGKVTGHYWRAPRASELMVNISSWRSVSANPA